VGRSTYRLYEVLGVPRDADADAIKRAWRAAARALHPDLNPDDPEAAARFGEASAAWGVLSDPRKRRIYDRYGDHAVDMDFHPSLDAAPPPRPRPARSTAADPGAVPWGWDGSGQAAEEGPGSRGGRARVRPDPRAASANPRSASPGSGPAPSAGPRRAVPRRGPDLRVEAVVPLRTAALGGPWQVEVDRPRPCEGCEGTGWRVGGRACATCQGTGAVTERAEVRFAVPPDTQNNRAITARGEGGAGLDGGEPGDVRITVKVAPHPTLTRRGLDLWTAVRLAPELARDGGTIEVRNLHELVQVEVPAGTPAGRTLRVKGRGVPGPAGRLPGDLHVRIDLEA
jgi:DnaJ-class molecular chaperone